MAWRLAKSLDVLRSQVNKKWPARDKTSDGTIGDAAHASRKSDHNPWVKDGNTGVVTGMDITHDPESGCDSKKLAETLRTSKDSRIKYLISNKRICNSEPVQGYSAWAWRPYTGSNSHDKHLHVSVKPDKDKYDSTVAWVISSEIKNSIPLPIPKPKAKEPDLPEPVVPQAEGDQEPDEKKPWYKKVWVWATSGGLTGVAGGIYDYRVAIVFGIVALVVFGIVWFTYLRDKLKKER